MEISNLEARMERKNISGKLNEWKLARIKTQCIKSWDVRTKLKLFYSISF
jgi:hypothetical protein